MINISCIMAEQLVDYADYDSEQECTTEDFESRLKSFREQYDLELGYYKQKINRYRNKWYRRWCRAFRDTLRKFRGRS